ncbi:hypothetical protein [Terrabacter sp. BE26]|uniref:hypothetical protein n=1 Tax=Terrabacter sp. BE26 TaxID=2898152 RepID=UPI0035BE3870
MTPHLKGHVRAYVDRALPPAMLHLFDKHLVVCTVCRAAADQERRIVAALRADTGVPTSLRTSLISLASAAAASASAGAEANPPRVPVPPVGFRMPPAPAHEPVPTVPPTAPALHRSPMRAAVVASIAAGASVAAAWGLAVSPVPGGGASSVRGPVANLSAGPASAVNLGGAVLPGTRVARVSRDPGRAGGLDSRSPFWVVSTRSAAPVGTSAAAVGSGVVSGLVTSVRITTSRSAQSRP